MNINEIFSPKIEKKLKKTLLILEGKRKKTVQNILKALLPFCFLVLLISGFITYKLIEAVLSEYRYSGNDPEVLLAGFVGLLFIALFAGWNIYKKKIKVFRKYIYEGQYAKVYKKEMIEKIIPLLNEKMVYNAEAGIPESDFRQSGFPLFSNLAAYYSSDSISGKTGRTTFVFAEVLAEQIVQSTSNQNSDLFRGIFFVADFHKKTDWNTIVYPDMFKYFSSLLVGKLSEEKQFSSEKYRRVKLEDVEFEKYFQVYGTDQVESRYVLSTALMARIVDFKKKTKKHIQFSFKDSKIYFAIHYSPRKSLFKPPMFKPVHNLKPLKDYFFDMQLMMDVIEELNLNSQLKTNT